MQMILKPGAFYGETVTFEAADALLTEVRHKIGRTVPPHAHECTYFSILLEGSYRETTQGVTIQFEPFTCVYHAALTEHTDTIGPHGCRMFFIELLPSWISTIDSLGAQPGANDKPPLHIVEMHGGEAAWLALRLYHEFLTRDSGTPLTVQSLLLELCTYVAHGQHDEEREPPWLNAVDGAIQSGFREGIEIASLAAMAGVHPSHLCRAFRRHRGRTIGDHVTDLRVQSVCRRLVDGDHSLSEAALEAGFTDQSHMSRSFKRLIGESPGAYRRRLRSGPSEPPHPAAH